MFTRIYHHLDEHVETYIASVALAVFTTLVVVQVVMRYAFGAPLTWSEELARYALVWFVWTAGSYAVRYQRHVKFNSIVELLGRKSPIAQRIIQLFVYLLWLAFLLLMLWLSIQMVLKQTGTGQLSPASRIPMYLVYLGLPIGMFLMSFRVIQHTVRAFQDFVKNPNAPVPPSQVEVD